MRLFLEYYSNTAAVTPSALLSVAAHAALIGAAVYGTGPRPDRPEAESTQVFYLAPPDRTPGREAIVEHLQFIDIGAGRQNDGPPSLSGQPAGQIEQEKKKSGGAVGTEVEEQSAQSSVLSPDSVYSVLTLEESSVRAEGSAAPVYPSELIKAGIEGSVLTRYVIDTTGRADSTSLQILSATHPGFVRAVREALPGMRFAAASVQGQKVRQLVEQNFEFHIASPVSAPAEHTRAKPVP